MPIDTQTPDSPGWWLNKLAAKLSTNRGRYSELDAYARGNPPLPWGPENCQDVFRRFQKKARANWSGLIVEAVNERMRPVGFRTGAEGDDNGDAEAWRLWQANSLDAESVLLHRAMLSMGDAYTIVGRPVGSTDPLISVEDPRQVVTACAPGNRRQTVAALKVFDDASDEYAYLYLPGQLLIAKRRWNEGAELDGSRWEWVSFSRLPFPVVPVVRFANRCDLYGRSLGEFEDVTDDIDRINVMLLQRLTIAIMQAFKQRAVKGDLPDRDPATGEFIDYSDIFAADPGALWRLPAGAEMWESGAVDLTPILESVKADVRDLAATTRTPMFYLFPDAANGSAEGASLQREGLVFKTNDRLTQTSDPWEQTMALAFLFAGDQQRASRTDMEVLWAPPERFSLAERYDAAVKAQAAGVPWRTVMTDVLQFSPQQVDRMEADRAADALLTPQAPQVVGAP